jgi:hypothetical protein
MNSKTLVHSIAAIALGFASLLPVASAKYDEVVQTSGTVSYVSGGIGTDSIERLSAISSDFNIKLMFALKSGEYVSDVGVVITNTSGNTLLDTTSNGPWLLARLPKGNYQIVATFSGNTIKRPVSVGAAKLSTVDFRWAAE